MSLSFAEASTELDVIVIGAGISGIGAAYYLQRDCPDKKFIILERRDTIGGTWDLFRYPGIRSDSDLFTFAYDFKPWTAEKSIASADTIKEYLHETVAENHIDKKICFGVKVVAADWSSSENIWKVTIKDEATASTRVLRSKWIFSAAGYYNYDQGFLPKFKDYDKFTGKIIHPQHWPEDYDYSDKKIVVIGSGATAVTIVPVMAKSAKHVTMLQRTPTYMVNLPEKDPLATVARKFFSDETSFQLVRKKNIYMNRPFVSASQKFPKLMRKLLVNHVRKQLPEGYDVETHFNPPYNPWDQRLCAVTNGDLFKCISKGDVSMMTDKIEKFTEHGLLLESGREIEADVIVTATGLNLQMLGGIPITIDHEPLNPAEKLTYRGSMLSDVPNLCFAVGYTTSSWTLKIGLLCEYFCRLLNHMDANHVNVCYPEHPKNSGNTRPLLDFGAGYVQRSISQLPRQGDAAPWIMPMDYVPDAKHFRHGPILDKFIKLTNHYPVNETFKVTDEIAV